MKKLALILALLFLVASTASAADEKAAGENRIVRPWAIAVNPFGLAFNYFSAGVHIPVGRLLAMPVTFRFVDYDDDLAAALSVGLRLYTGGRLHTGFYYGALLEYGYEKNGADPATRGIAGGSELGVLIPVGGTMRLDLGFGLMKYEDIHGDGLLAGVLPVINLNLTFPY